MSSKEQILDLYYSEHLKQKEIANIVGTSTQYVSKVVRAYKRNKEEKEFKTNSFSRFKTYLCKYSFEEWCKYEKNTSMAWTFKL